MAETTGSVLERLSSVPEKPRSTLSRLSGATEDDSSTLGTIASEAGKAAFGLGASAVQGVETLANELLPEGIAKTLTLDNSVGNFLESIQQGFGPQKEGAAATIGQAIGGVAPSFALGATVGLPAMIGVFALSMFNDAFEEAEAAGVSDAKKWAFAASVAGLAPLEAVPVGRTLSILNRGTGGLLQKFVKKGGSASIKKLFEVAGRHKSGRALLAVLQAAPEEAIQESLLNQIPENLLAKAFGVDPDRQAFAGAGRAALLGAIGGGVGAAAISPFTGGPQDAARTKDQIEEAGRPTAVQGQPTQTQPEVEAQAGVAQREGEGATEAVIVTLDDVPTITTVTDSSQPKSARVSEAKVANVKLKPGTRVVSPEGTAITTPRTKDLTAQAKRVVGEDVQLPSKTETTGEQLAEEARRDGFVQDARRFADEQAASETPEQMDAKRVIAANERLHQINFEVDKIILRQSKTKDHAEIQLMESDLVRLRDDFEVISAQSIRSGSETGLALRARRFALDESFNLFTLGKTASDNQGSPLTAEQEAELREAVLLARELEQKIAARDEVIRRFEAERELKDKGKRTRSRKRSKQSPQQELNDHIAAINSLKACV